MPPNLEALLICEDVRFELSGQITLVGLIHSSEVQVLRNRPSDTLCVVVLLSGMEGIEQLSHAVGVFSVKDDPSKLPEPSFPTKRQPESDRHTIAHRLGGILFPEPGEYLIKVVVTTGDTVSTFTRKLQVEYATDDP